MYHKTMKKIEVLFVLYENTHPNIYIGYEDRPILYCCVTEVNRCVGISHSVLADFRWNSGLSKSLSLENNRRILYTEINFLVKKIYEDLKIPSPVGRVNYNCRLTLSPSLMRIVIRNGLPIESVGLCDRRDMISNLGKISYWG